MVVAIIGLIGLSVLNYFLLMENKRLTAFIMIQKDSGAYAQTTWKPWEMTGNEPLTPQQQNEKDYIDKMSGMECDDKDIERFGESYGEIT